MTNRVYHHLEGSQERECFNTSHSFSILLFFFFVFLMPTVAYTQLNERRIFLWDVSGSLLPMIKGEKDLDNSPLPCIPSGNGLWKSLKYKLIESIENIEDDAMNEIILIPFYTRTLDPVCVKTTPEGKSQLKDYITNFHYKSVGNNKTNLVDAIRKYHDMCRDGYVNYLFLFTDGVNEVGDLQAELNDWNRKSQNPGQYSYGFYILVHPDADVPYIRKAIDKQTNFWVVPDANVSIQICNMPTQVAYNLRDDKDLTIPLSGSYRDIKGKINLNLEENPYCTLQAAPMDIYQGKIHFSLCLKNTQNIPEQFDLHLRVNYEGGSPYTFITPEQLTIHCINKKERTLKISIE